MYPVSPAFIDALYAPSMRVAVRVTTTDGVVLATDGGSVSMDSRRGIQRACDLTLIPVGGLSTAELYRLVMLPSTEIKVERGLVVDGVDVFASLGVFSTDNAEYDRAAGGSVKWSGSDRARKISRARFTDPYQIAAGTSLAGAGAALLTDRWPSVECDFAGVSEVIGAQLVFEFGSDSDPWERARELFADHGYDLHFDGDGICRATPIPDPAETRPAFSFGSGETSLMLGATTKGSLEETYNGVIASGEGSDVVTAVRFEAWDTDPQSPTYYGYGKVPYFYSSPLLTDVAKCEKAAVSMLAKVKGRTEQLAWPALVNPALEPLDVVSVILDGVESRCVLDSLTIPLRASESMSANARETRRQ